MGRISPFAWTKRKPAGKKIGVDILSSNSRSILMPNLA